MSEEKEPGTITNFIRKQVPHLTPMLIDGFIWTMTPTLTFFSTIEKVDSKTILQGSVIFLGALGAFRSKIFGNWRNEREKITETEYLRRALEKQENAK